MTKLVECVPNFSEGRDRKIIDAIADAVRSVSDVKLLDVDPGADTNRTVYTFVGTPEGVKEAAFQAAKKAHELIDMSTHSGAHPRMGAMDVCPFVPVSGVTMDDCVQIARDLGKRLGEELEIPVYLYEFAAASPERQSLADIRTGEYEALEEKLKDPKWKPDFGPAKFKHKWGASVVGAREFLIAYNVNVNTKDKKLANEIALNIREGGRAKKDASGKIVKDEKGNSVKIPGRLKAVRAIGWYIDQYRQAQVSINLINYNTTPLHVVFETAREEAEKLGLIVTGSELVGLVPLKPMLDAGKFYLKKQGKSAGAPEKELVEIAVRSLGLDQLSEFDPAKKIVEYNFLKPAPLMSLTARDFVDEVSSESPAPGGGSVAALAGSLCAALSAMVANLTVGKPGYEKVWKELSDLAQQGQEIKDQLAKAVDEDTNAFNHLMEAMRLPKTTPEQKATREAAMEDGYKKAAAVPLQTAQTCLEAMKISLIAAQKGNANSASDAGVAALMARAGVEGAVLNVLINLGSIKDQAFKDSHVKDCQGLKQESADLCDTVQQAVMKNIKI
ncbi:MAG: glutamate formimidoyltransferase [Candidatus Edwardsbacteria bacterium RIFOXYD12_FULL_50_11]|uniref:Formimidoyltransferase-cyclodeaminase n=1 Tax=Candidatus Edwardsbacteria bacterium GWF2_54_11 TaxID=1817851 RepID=A0A1F5R217_9BACT|nr:MAG: glutamate formimidoyltransferase [Candidatus Edwardsbacteria bacterium RifOxyC12_full_54_24]OGF08439.1 MAG: glutamate formimidoyltransferase [Candidatus Edwardsbacteria bacterium GWF2_54_11]OGF09115.1 MAG: glutamate formimidoyltransferase [Candidatus Edwardsbacteria bacterium RifOxyA12_full_54_48]OGF12361.1 MAG: glutamate formimidoyltransferase [Candidatus Edwardsbacteria bacterium GWE2_54_12]OGF17534.1 MAG: glutamate formimidoyltransferase [Candidatus Edwardsbacteria bacterium RIFOXYD1